MNGDEQAILELEHARERWAALRARIAALKGMALEQLTMGELDVLLTTPTGQQPDENRKPPEH